MSVLTDIISEFNFACEIRSHSWHSQPERRGCRRKRRRRWCRLRRSERTPRQRYRRRDPQLRGPYQHRWSSQRSCPSRQARCRRWTEPAKRKQSSRGSSRQRRNRHAVGLLRLLRIVLIVVIHFFKSPLKFPGDCAIARSPPSDGIIIP